MSNDNGSGATLTAVLDSGPSFGTISNWDNHGGFTYTPNHHAFGTDQFTYHDVNQYQQVSNEATVTIAVLESAPTDTNLGYGIKHDTVLTVSPAGVLSTAHDNDPPDAGHLTASLVTPPSLGTLSDYIDANGVDHPLLVDGSFVLTPPAHWAGVITFAYAVTDGIYTSPNYTITVNVTDQAPVVKDAGPYYVAPDDEGTDGDTLTVAAPGVLAGAYDGDGDAMTAELVSSPAHGSVVLNADGSFTYTVADGYTGTDTFTFVAFDGIKQSPTPATATLYDILGDLQAATVDGGDPDGELDRTIEDTQGAFVPIDNVDQNYNGDPDFADEGAIQGEKDLLPIYLKMIAPSVGGTYSLLIPSDIIKVWRSPDRTGEVMTGTPFDATADTKLYVEGIDYEPGPQTLVLNWSNGYQTFKADSLKITVFNWNGPENVPGAGTYTYTASDALDGQGSSKWITPISGTEKASTDDDAGGPDIQQIAWSSGPAVGEAVYQAAPGYVWDYDVNIVNISIGATSIKFKNPPVQSADQANGILSVDPTNKPAMLATVVINSITGPIVNGQMRGVKHISAGFAQNVTIEAKHGVFSGFKPAQQWVSSLEGSSCLDTVLGSALPWYNSGTNIPALADAPSGPFTLTTDDSPQGVFSDMFELTGGGQTEPITSESLIYNFVIYIAARTDDPSNGANSVYAQVAAANWQFDGSGTLASAGGQNKFGEWQAAQDTGNSADAKFTPVSNGANVPITTGPTANQAPESWKTKPGFP